WRKKNRAHLSKFSPNNATLFVYALGYRGESFDFQHRSHTRPKPDPGGLAWRNVPGLRAEPAHLHPPVDGPAPVPSGRAGQGPWRPDPRPAVYLIWLPLKPPLRDLDKRWPRYQ